MNKITSNQAILGWTCMTNCLLVPPIIDQLVCYDYELLNRSVV